MAIKVVIDEGVPFSVNFRRSENGGVGKLFEHGLLAQPLCLEPFRSVGGKEFLEELDVRLSTLQGFRKIYRTLTSGFSLAFIADM